MQRFPLGLILNRAMALQIGQRVVLVALQCAPPLLVGLAPDFWAAASDYFPPVSRCAAFVVYPQVAG